MKKLKIVGIVAVLLLLVSLVGTAQAETKVSAPEVEWIKTFGGPEWDGAYSVQLTSDGGYIITGYTISYSGAECRDVWLIKTDPQGNEVWNKTFGGSDVDIGYSVTQVSDGGYIIVGSTASYGSGLFDVWLIKTDSEGNEMWNRTFGGSDPDEGTSVMLSSDGGYIITGESQSYGAGGGGIWLIKTDSEGNEVWNRTFGGDGGIGMSILQTSDGGYIVTGKTPPGVDTSYGARDIDVWLIKTDSNGKKEWDKTFSGKKKPAYGKSVASISNGGFIIVGTIASSDDMYGNIWLIKTDSNGKKLWDKTFGGDDLDTGWSVLLTSDGYIITGVTSSYGAGKSDGWLIKTDAKGNKEWDRTFGGGSSDGGFSVAQSSDGRYIIAGYTESYGAGGEDVWLIKVAPEEKPMLQAPSEEKATSEIPTGEEKGIPGFEVVFVLGGLLVVAYVLRRCKK